MIWELAHSWWIICLNGVILCVGHKQISVFMCLSVCTNVRSCKLVVVSSSVLMTVCVCVCVACARFCLEVCVAFCYLTHARVCSYRAGHSRGPPSSCRSQRATTSPGRLWCTGPLSHQTSAPLECRSGCSPRKSKGREAKACWWWCY